MTYGEWILKAEEAGEHYWAYREFVHDNPEAAMSAYEAGVDPFDYVKEQGIRLDLHEFGPAWGGW